MKTRAMPVSLALALVTQDGLMDEACRAAPASIGLRQHRDECQPRRARQPFVRRFDEIQILLATASPVEPHLRVFLRAIRSSTMDLIGAKPVPVARQTLACRNRYADRIRRTEFRR